jgi:oxygen-dependent protoporphyrinogen oxidase
VLVRIMLGGGRDPDALALDDAEIVAIARRDLKAIRGITSEPAFVRLVRQVPGLPQYTLGHPERLARIDERLGHHDGLRLVGNSYHGVALNACISNARRLADTLLAEAR